MSDYVLVPSLERATVADYVALFAQSFAGDNKLNASYLGWQYESNPHGKVIGMDAFLGDELAAHYAIIPRRYRLGVQVFDAALSVNTATHPQHQGKGLFTKLAAATYELAAQRGVKFVVGAANANSVGGFTRKLGFTALGQIRLYASFKGARPADDALGLALDTDWLRWRLLNPSRQFQAVRHGDGTSTIRTRVKAVAFNIARLDSAILDRTPGVATLERGSQLLPGFTPHFGIDAPSPWRLPLRAQPSPWHVIWRSLDPSSRDDLSTRLRFDGISMDTF